MSQCPYRKEHEWDDSGMCRHCYAVREVTKLQTDVLPPGLFEWGPMANFWCSVAGCQEKASIVVTKPGRYSTRCQAHKDAA